MDEVESAIVSVSEHVEADRAEAWFEVLCGAIDDFGENWSLFKDSLATRAYGSSFDDEVAEAFVTYMDEGVSDQVEVLQQIASRREGLPRLYERLVAEQQQALAELAGETPAESQAVASWDPKTAAEWYLYLTQTMGNGWPGWTGDESEWEPFKHFFLTYAEQAGVSPEATQLLTGVEAYPNKVEGFREHGITIAVPAPVGLAPPPSSDQWGNYSVKEWYDYLTTGWDGWSGREEDWEAFKYYFLEYAGNANAGNGAAQFIQEIEDSGSKHDELAKYDIYPVVPAPPTTPPPAPPIVSTERPPTVNEEAGEVEDAGPWVEFLTKNIGRYKGSGSWNAYRAWLLAEARGQGFGSAAEAFVEYADNLKNKDEAFTELGIAVGVAQAPTAAQPPAEPGEESASTSSNVPPPPPPPGDATAPTPPEVQPVSVEKFKEEIAQKAKQTADRIETNAVAEILKNADLPDDVPRDQLEKAMQEYLRLAVEKV